VAAHGARELGPQVEGRVLLLLVEEPELGALCGVDDGEDAGDAFPDVVSARLGSVVCAPQSKASLRDGFPRLRCRLHPVQLGRGAARALLRAETNEFLSHLLELLHQLVLALAPQGVRLDVAGGRLQGIVSGRGPVNSGASMNTIFRERRNRNWRR
jgi:hypothetical protein